MRIRPEIYVSTVNQMAAALNQARSNIAGSQARVTQLQAQLEGMEASYKRTKRLHEEKVISNAEYDKALADYQAMQAQVRSEEHTSELQSLMRNSYAVFCLKKKKKKQN